MDLFDPTRREEILTLPDPLLAKADDFTTGLNPLGGETRVLGIWLIMVFHAVGLLPLTFAKSIIRALNQTPTTLPGRNLATGLRSEHYRSLLPPDLTEITDAQRETLIRLHDDFEATVQDFLALPEPAQPPQKPPADPPGGDVLDSLTRGGV